MHRGKVDPGVSELPRGNELSRDHVNRPLDFKDKGQSSFIGDTISNKIVFFRLTMVTHSMAKFNMIWIVEN